jgi:hypothetical protein
MKHALLGIMLILFATNSNARQPDVVDPLARTQRGAWHVAECLAQLDSSNGNPIRIEASQTRATISPHRSAVYETAGAELLRLRPETGTLAPVEVWRISGRGANVARVRAPEARPVDGALLIVPPPWISAPLYEIRLPAGSPERSLTLVADRLVREPLPFYADDVLAEARRDIETGSWQARAARLWDALEPGDRARELYRRELAALPWVESGAAPEWVILYRRASLRLNLAEWKGGGARVDAPRSLHLDGPGAARLDLDNQAYVLGTSFTTRVDERQAVEIATRLPYTTTVSHEVQTYWVDVWLNDRFLERLFFDTRLDDVCALRVDPLGRPLGRPRAKSLPRGSGSLRLRSSVPVYLSITERHRRGTLRERFQVEDVSRHFRDAAVAAERALAREPGNTRAAFVRAAALVATGEGASAVDQLVRLAEAETDTTLGHAARILRARLLVEAEHFEEALASLGEWAPPSRGTDLEKVVSRAVALEGVFERARVLRLLDRHALAAAALADATFLDPIGVALPEAQAEALKWVPELHTTNPALVASFDRALALAPVDGALRTARQRAWYDFTYWQPVRALRTNGAAGRASFDPLCGDATEPEAEADSEGAELGQECDVPVRPIDYARRDARFFQVPLLTPFRVDLRDPFEHEEGVDRVRLRVVHNFREPFELIVTVDNREAAHFAVTARDQTFEFSLVRALRQIEITVSPAATDPGLRLFIDRSPVSDLYTRESDLPSWQLFAERDYLPLGGGEAGRVEILTRDDPAPVIARLLLQVGEARSPIPVTILVDGKQVEQLVLDPALGRALFGPAASPGPFGLLFELPAGRHLVTFVAGSERELWASLAFRTRRQERMGVDE